MNHFINAFKQYSDFKGRTPRKEYWMFVLIYLVINVSLAFLNITILSVIASVVIFLPSISIATRRLHDTGRSGWWQLLCFIPIIGLIILLVLLAQKTKEDVFVVSI
ncbi:hypothetical protein PCNPT3_03675 [Psychromonas sp. CNPT3]|uniref:DUF805 domain-containing protein n=1 Tax=Psychromonas sp. CNPT3 TaxID=314282 RepID=UPI00006E486D|nr:DUF805 domain-containing protein [Psychromonas sp. CNPT3]AGH80677.1 hypothetical protein PCNPT3_03675 [Psychromonas sp. CNPT3]